MAKRRCISVDFYDSEMFCELPVSAKHLYTELILHSDDDGVVINPKSVLRICRAKASTLQMLVRHNLLLEIDGVYIIRHWYVHNKIQSSRKVDSAYSDTLFKLRVNERKEYEVYGDILLTNCQPNITKPNLTKDNLTEMKSNEVKKTEVSETCGSQDTRGNHLIGFDKTESENSSEERAEAIRKRYREALERAGIKR